MTTTALHLVNEGTPGFAGLVGRSPAMRAVFEQMKLFAASMAPVYVVGETGTGKEYAARGIHSESPRGRGPFVAVNAAAVSDDIFDSEFFGHVRGAFTGATVSRDGYVTAAQGGTLFIDEVADLSPRAQVKLLRFLQEKEYRRVGECQVRRADVRVVVAANVELTSRVASGQFREDLFFRLNALVLRLPPLRERIEDIAPLARHLLKRAAEADGRPAPRLAEDALGVLQAHHWPGNVRDLQNVLHRTLVMAPGEVVRAADLPPEVTATKLVDQASLARAKDSFEREYILRVLKECGGSRTRAARRCGVTRQGLSLKCKRLGIGGQSSGRLRLKIGRQE